MQELIRLLRQASVSGREKIGDAAAEQAAGITHPRTNPFKRAAQDVHHSLSPEVRARNRAGLDAYVRSLKSVNQELGQLADQKLADKRVAGKALTVRDVRQVASRDLVGLVERQANDLKSGFLSRGVFGGGRPWSGSANDEMRLTQVRQSLELVMAHLSETEDTEALGRLNSIAHQLDQLRGLETGQWVVPAARLATKGQRRLEVFNPSVGKMVKTSVTRADWKDMHAAHADYQAGRDPRDEAAVRRTAMAVIAATGQTRGLRFLERAPTAALVDLARQIGLGTYEEFDALHEVQREEDSKVLDRESLRLLDAYNANREAFRTKLGFERVKAAAVQPVRAHAQPDPVVDTPQEVKNLRAFYAECLSPEFILDIETVPTAERLKQLCCKHPLVLLDLATVQDRGPESEIPPQVLAQLGAMVEPGLIQQVLASETLDKQTALITAHFQSLPPSAYEGLARALDESIATVEPAITEVMTGLATKFGAVGGNQARFLSQAIVRYFSGQAPVDQKAMVASYMRGAVPDSPNSQRLAALIKGAGPYLIKMLQMVGDNLEGEGAREYKDALGFVKSGLPSIHPELRNAMLSAVINDSNGEITGLKAVRSLNAASVGETFYTLVERADGSTEPIVLKLLRPGIAERAGRERLYMDSVAQSVPGMAGTFAGIADQIEGEMDLRTEAANVRMGQVYDARGDLDVKSVKLIPGSQERSFYMMMEQAPGSNVAHYNKLLTEGNFRDEAMHPYVVGSRLATLTANLAEKWVEEALFGSGFYHGDLHAGNLMYKADEGGPNGALTVIDFGNGKVLSPQDRQAVFKMMMTATMKRPEEFCRHFESILSAQARSAMTPEVRGQFLARLNEIFNVEGRSPGVSISLALDAANALYIEVPGVISNFSRSEVMLENALNELSDHNERNWPDFTRKMQEGEALVTKRTKSFHACLDDLLEKARQASAPTLRSLEQIRIKPPRELTNEDIQLLRAQPQPMGLLTQSLLTAINLTEQTLPESQPPTRLIGDVILSVLERHRTEAISLGGIGLAARAARGAI
jgi:predicted unusual protein kinase regulating ubiquinone biosynthesis (AarF/ABC1/UbiB family)